MSDDEEMVERFESHRPRLESAAHRMLGSRPEAEDAVQEAWVRYQGADRDEIRNLGGWLTTVVARICLDRLRARGARPEEPWDLEDIDRIGAADTGDPVADAELADTVGLAMLVVLERLSPAERVAFVLHDVFAVPFDEVSVIVGRSPQTAKKLASRARARIRGGDGTPARDVARQRDVAVAFLRAARTGDIDALVAVLHPDVVRRADGEPLYEGVEAVAAQIRTTQHLARSAAVAVVDGVPGLVVAPGGRLGVALQLRIEDDRVREITVIRDPARLRSLDLALFDVVEP